MTLGPPKFCVQEAERDKIINCKGGLFCPHRHDCFSELLYANNFMLPPLSVLNECANDYPVSNSSLYTGSRKGVMFIVFVVSRVLD